MQNDTKLFGIDTAIGIRMILEEMCFKYHGAHDESWNKKIESLYFSLRNAPYFARQSNPLMFRGYPGMGKTTSFGVASRMFADFMGLDYKPDPTEADLEEWMKDGSISEKFILVKHEMAGEVSNMQVAGIPSKKEVDGVEYLSQLKSLKFHALTQAKAACLVIDDFLNAHASVQNQMLPIFEEGRFQGTNFGNTYIVGTGNLGAKDNTNISNMSSANATRLQSYNVTDTVENWIARAEEQYQDDIGDALLGNFFKSYLHTGDGSIFHKPSNDKDGSPYPCARTWSKLLGPLRVYYNEAKYFMEQGLGYDHLTTEINRAASGLVGKEAASSLEAYYTSVFSGAMPAAVQIIKDGSVNEKLATILKEQLVTSRHTQSAHWFANQFGAALADEAIAAFKKAGGDKNKEDGILNNIVSGWYDYGMEPAKISYAVASFKDKLVLRLKDKAGFVNDEGVTQLSEDMKTRLDMIVGRNPVAQTDIGDGNSLAEDTYVAVISNSAFVKDNFDDDLGRNTHAAIQEIAEKLNKQKTQENNFNSTSQYDDSVSATLDDRREISETPQQINNVERKSTENPTPSALVMEF